MEASGVGYGVAILPCRIRCAKRRIFSKQSRLEFPTIAHVARPRWFKGRLRRGLQRGPGQRRPMRAPESRLTVGQNVLMSRSSGSGRRCLASGYRRSCPISSERSGHRCNSVIALLDGLRAHCDAPGSTRPIPPFSDAGIIRRAVPLPSPASHLAHMVWLFLRTNSRGPARTCSRPLQPSRHPDHDLARDGDLTFPASVS